MVFCRLVIIIIIIIIIIVVVYDVFRYSINVCVHARVCKVEQELSRSWRPYSKTTRRLPFQ